MNVLKMQAINRKIEDAFHDMVAYLEEDRIYPSTREAGTAPSDKAVDNCYEMLVTLIKELMSTGMNYQDIGRKPTFEEIVETINSVQDDNTADDIDDLREIESFVRDNGESKYRYVNTVYEHIPTKRYICVEEQRGVGDWCDLTSSVTATETFKKEIVKYEWQ